MKKLQGFTIIELMLVLLVLAILVSVAVPSMRNMIMGRELVGQATDVASAFAFARAEATSIMKPVVICASSTGNTCSNSTDWSTGWIIFSDETTTYTYSAADGDTILKVEGPMNGGVSLSANVSGLAFGISGESLAAVPVTFDLCAENATGGNVIDINKSRKIIVNQAGSASITVGDASC